MLTQGEKHRERPETFSGGDEGGINWMLIGVGIIVVIALAFLAVPATKGYKAYRAMTDAGVPEQYVTDMQGLAGAKAQVDAQLASTQAGLDTCTANLGSCTTDLDGQKKLVESLGKDLSARAAAIDELEQQVEDQQGAVEDAARRICCADKALRDPAINGYVLNKGKIACVVDGGEDISC